MHTGRTIYLRRIVTTHRQVSPVRKMFRHTLSPILWNSQFMSIKDLKDMYLFRFVVLFELY